MIVWLKKTKQIYDRIFNRNWPVPFLAVLINLVSGEFQAGFKILKQNKHDEEHGPDRSMMSFTAYFTSGGAVVSSAGSYIICTETEALFGEEQEILPLFRNAVSRMKLTGRGFRCSGDLAEFFGNFHRNWPVPFWAVSIRFRRVSGTIQNTEKQTNKQTRPGTRQSTRPVHDVIHCLLYFRWSGSFEYRKLYHLFKQKHFLFSEGQKILYLLWNAVSKIFNFNFYF